jgi:hypothetical protein
MIEWLRYSFPMALVRDFNLFPFTCYLGASHAA